MKLDAQEIFLKLKNSDITALSKAMTVIESNADKHKAISSELLDLSEKEKTSTLRIGVSGMPGAGKSTFIEDLGCRLIEKGHKVAVLAVDPSSSVSRGSILGDKTRMDRLANSDSAFIRPSPSAGDLGGVTEKTRDLISLCEAAGFDIILVETVGIGQSEVEVKNITDVFLLLILPGGGDELQGIKKGAVELADFVIINKADGNNRKLAEITKTDYQMANRIVGNKSGEWRTKVLTCSALNGKGMDDILNEIFLFEKEQRRNGKFELNRANQKINNLKNNLKSILINNFFNKSDNKKLINELEKKIINNEISLKSASEIIKERL